eukprot:TCALIF_01363-PA protein Name:"Protein of unknown function" AED:0.31 eAED:0.82 QI:0/0/0/1/0/0/3/0/171
MKSVAKGKKVSFSDESSSNVPTSGDFAKQVQDRLLGDPQKSTFEKKYFQNMLARIQSKTNSSKIPRRVKVDQETKHMNKFVNDVLNRTYPFTNQVHPKIELRGVVKFFKGCSQRCKRVYQNMLEETRSAIRRIPALRKMPMTQSLDEIGNLVLELDNNLDFVPGDLQSRIT